MTENRDEVVILLERAREEITRLRHANETMQARLGVLDLISLLVNGRQPVVMTEDIVWKIDSFFTRLKESEKFMEDKINPKKEKS